LNSFDALDLIEPLRRAIAKERFEKPTEIQAQAIPPLLAGEDVLGVAQTGTGKTAAFLLPVLQGLAGIERRGKPRIRALILSPTRELAAQIDESCGAYSRYLPFKHMVMYGGVSQRPQVDKLRNGIDILVATPGRLLDLHGQGFLDFRDINYFILDEADRMLDMGFIRDIRKILALLPDARQNMLFSATMPDSIAKLAGSFLSSPVRVEVTPQSTAVERIEQHVMFVDRPNKKHLLCQIMQDSAVTSAIIFTRTKHGADRVARILNKANLSAAAIHGNKSQGARLRALNGFRSGDVLALVATDIAARGIDVDRVSHVINHDIPNISETYVHRIGRTGRAGREGVAISFCDETETIYLRDIQRLIGTELHVIDDHQWHHPDAIPTPENCIRNKAKTKAMKAEQGRRGGRGRPNAKDSSEAQGAQGDPKAGRGDPDDSGNRPGRGRRRSGRSGAQGRRNDGNQASADGKRSGGGQSRSGGQGPKGQGAQDNGGARGGQQSRRRRRRRSGSSGGPNGPRNSSSD